MATLAALGKTCARPAISAALWSQDHFFARKTQFSWSPRLYFFDEQGNSLAFIRNTLITPAQDIRLFSDPTLSFELLTVRAVPGETDLLFEVHDPLNREAVGTIRQVPRARLQRRHWVLVNSAGDEVGGVSEDSLLLTGMRRVFAEIVPQSYTFMCSEKKLGRARQGGRIFSPEMEINLTSDTELDRRLVTAAVIVLMIATD